jgi:hypothetical protein
MGEWHLSRRDSTLVRRLALPKQDRIMLPAGLHSTGSTGFATGAGDAFAAGVFGSPEGRKQPSFNFVPVRIISQREIVSSA